jgi:cholest-4-en-3-one 26-monooxygenase
MDLSSIDNRLNNPQWYTTGEHHAAFATLRREDPVHWTEDKEYGLNYWSVTRYDDVDAILNDPNRFSSRNTARLLPTSQRITPEDRWEQMLLVTPTAMDNPLHDLYRRPVNKFFSIPAIGRLTEQVDQHVADILGEVAGREEIDLVEEVAAQVPLRVMLSFLGVPGEDWPLLRRLTNQYFLPRDPRFAISDDPKASQLDAIKGLDRYARAMMVDRRQNPREDFATVVSQLRIDGDLLSPYEMSSWVTTLIRGGLETTANAGSVGMWQFLENPDQRDLLLRDPSLIDSAIDEILRFASPVRHVLRMARDSVEVRGKRINSGDSTSPARPTTTSASGRACTAASGGTWPASN